MTDVINQQIRAAAAACGVKPASIEDAAIYIGAIQGCGVSGDALDNFLRAVGRGIPVVVITEATDPAPLWMLQLAEMVFVLPPPANWAAGMRVAAKLGHRLLHEERHIGRRRLN